MQEPQISFRGPEWFCGIVAPGCDVRAQNHIEELGYRTFVPRLRKWAGPAKQRRVVERPILGRYIFVEVDADRQGFWHLSRARGLSEVLSVCKIPMVIPRFHVEDLLGRFIAGEFDQVIDAAIPLGARVMIVEGEFANMLATVTGMRGNHRATVKLDGQRKYVQLSEYSLRAAIFPKETSQREGASDKPAPIITDDGRSILAALQRGEKVSYPQDPS